MTIADLNKDNHADIAIANGNSNSICVFFGFGNGSLGTRQLYSTGFSSKPTFISAADLNNDSWLDLAVVNHNTNNVGVLIGHSNGYFGSQATYPTGSGSVP